MIVLTIILIFVAAICKALADTLDHHFFTSKFKNKSQKYWNPNIITKTAPQIFGFPLDAWHVTNTIQIAAWLGFGILYKPVLPQWWMDFGAAGIIFIIVFNTFYNKVFR